MNYKLLNRINKLFSIYLDSNQYGESSHYDNGQYADDSDEDDDTETGMIRRHRGESEGE